MKLQALSVNLLALALGSSCHAFAQEQGYWRAASKTAQSITGDVGFGGDKISINFASFTIAQIRALKSDELSAAFDTTGDTAGGGHLYRLSIPPEKRFAHKNTLCGTDETQWMATYVSGKNGRDLKIAFFSNANPPVFTPEALNDSPNLCGTYTYVR